MTNVQIRKMEKGDCERIYEIEQLSFPGTSWTLEDFRDGLESDSQFYFVALLSGTPVGFVVLYSMVDCGDLVNIAVHPEYRGQGISKLLMDGLMEQAHELKLETITLEVRAGNAVAKALYEKYGFQRIAVRKNYYKNPVEHAEIMQISLYSR